MYTIQDVMYTIQDIMYTIQDVMYTIQDVMYTIQDIMYTIQDIMYTIQDVTYTIQDVMTLDFCFSHRRCSRCQPSGMLHFLTGKHFLPFRRILLTSSSRSRIKDQGSAVPTLPRQRQVTVTV
jgi:hypothetical protein